jgi:hypothetical protein
MKVRRPRTERCLLTNASAWPGDVGVCACFPTDTPIAELERDGVAGDAERGKLAEAAQHGAFAVTENIVFVASRIRGLRNGDRRSAHEAPLARHEHASARDERQRVVPATLTGAARTAVERVPAVRICMSGSWETVAGADDVTPACWRVGGSPSNLPNSVNLPCEVVVAHSSL